MNIDFGKLITYEDKQALVLSSRPETVKRECRARIYAVVNKSAQLNLAAAAAVGQLDSEQMDVYRSGLDWIVRMRAACGRNIVDLALQPEDAISWPTVPLGVPELADQF